MPRRNYLFLLASSVFALVIIASNPEAKAQNLSGAIFTTDATSTFVNGNVYNSIYDVYLNGGPRPNAPCTAAGLPNGYYYFQVTDPSGSVLLSIDDIGSRQVYVEGGVIVAVSSHETGTGKCQGSKPSNITVKLAPFEPTPNPGGEYKVWMTPVEFYSYDPTRGFHGFIPSKSKTDNFKVVPPVDSDNDGIPDADEIPGCELNPDPFCGMIM